MQRKNSWSMAVFYSQADKFYPFRRRAIDSNEVFGFIVREHQTNPIHSGKSKTFTALNQQFFGIKHQEVAFLLKHRETCAQTKPQTRTARVPSKPRCIAFLSTFKST